MNEADRRTALAALGQARPAIMRLEVDRHPEDVAADLIEGWSAVETALRSLLGGSALSGQPLVHELRQRQLISIDEAHSLVRFLDARTRASRTEYRPTQADCDAAREAFSTLEASLSASDGYAAAPPPRAASSEPLAATIAPAHHASRRRSPWLAVAGAVALLAIVGAAAWFALRPSAYETAMENGRELFRSGSPNAAVGAFNRAAREDPQAAAPHIYLGRIAREQGDLATATRELTRAIELGPTNGDALREMGSLQLVRGDNNLARNFYVRAVQANADDRVAMGYLACALARLGRLQESNGFLQRAGDGPWSGCVVPILQQSMAPPGAAIPR
jgi:Flp pilus assembly protein TadD